MTLRTVALVVLAFSAARWAAMGFNRVADRRFDAVNPRTRNRELPRGALTVGQAGVSIVAAAALFVTAAALIAVMQAAGVLFTNILINDTPGDVSGMFANRNHFALLAAIGCLIAPVWAFSNRHRPGWRGAVAHALVIIFVLAILASGSRAGLMLGGVAIVLALLIGITTGTYSSIFVASMLLTSWHLGDFRWLFPRVRRGLRTAGA